MLSRSVRKDWLTLPQIPQVKLIVSGSLSLAILAWTLHAVCPQPLIQAVGRVLQHEPRPMVMVVAIPLECCGRV